MYYLIFLICHQALSNRYLKDQYKFYMHIYIINMMTTVIKIYIINNFFLFFFCMRNKTKLPALN